MYAFKNLTDILELKTIRVLYQALIESIISYVIKHRYLITNLYT